MLERGLLSAASACSAEHKPWRLRRLCAFRVLTEGQLLCISVFSPLAEPLRLCASALEIKKIVSGSRNNACSTRRTTSFGGDCHTNLTDAWRHFYALKRIGHQTGLQCGKVSHEAAVTLREMLELSRKLSGETNFVLHLKIPPKKAFSLRRHLSNPANPSWPDIFQLSHHARIHPSVPLQNLLLWARRSHGNVLHGNGGRHAHHCEPCAGNGTVWRGTLWN